MGNSCAKGPPRDADETDGKAGFRDRRLSVSQIPEGKSPGNSRRLSVYQEDQEPKAQTLETIPSVSVKSVAGMEPVPGGANRKINQARTPPPDRILGPA